MTKKEKILKAAELPRPSEDQYYQAPIEYWQYLEEENKRLTPLITAMADRIEQLEAALGFYAQHPEDAGMWEEFVGQEDTGDKARQALQPGELDKLLEGE